MSDMPTMGNIPSFIPLLYDFANVSACSKCGRPPQSFVFPKEDLYRLNSCPIVITVGCCTEESRTYGIVNIWRLLEWPQDFITAMSRIEDENDPIQVELKRLENAWEEFNRKQSK